jgi:hypothetical protein
MGLLMRTMAKSFAKATKLPLVGALIPNSRFEKTAAALARTFPKHPSPRSKERCSGICWLVFSLET